VLVAGAIADKPARLVAASDPVELRANPPRFVSRGGEKLEAALDRFGIEVTGRRVLDAGASTGGFTDCLLQAGAREVVAVDVGRGQLDERLRRDPRVNHLEGTDVRSLTLAQLGGRKVDAAVADLSFISLTSVVAGILGLVEPGGPVVLLVKPQFEAGRREASRGRGVIRDPEVHRRCLLKVADAVHRSGGRVVGAMASPVLGRSGNREFLLLAHAPVPAPGPAPAPAPAPTRSAMQPEGSPDLADTLALVDEVVATAHGARQDGPPWR